MTIKAKTLMMITTIDKNFDAARKTSQYSNTMTMTIETLREFILDLIESEKKERRLVSKEYVRRWDLFYMLNGVKEVIVRDTRFYMVGGGNWFDIVQDLDKRVFLQVEGSDEIFMQKDIADVNHIGVNVFLESLSKDMSQMLKDDENYIHACITNTLIQLPHMGSMYIHNPLTLQLTESLVRLFVVEERAKGRAIHDHQHIPV